MSKMNTLFFGVPSVRKPVKVASEHPQWGTKPNASRQILTGKARDPMICRDSRTLRERKPPDFITIYALGQNFDAFANRQSQESQSSHRTLQAVVNQLESLGTNSVPVSLDPNSPPPIPNGSGVPRIHKCLYLASYLKDGSLSAWYTSIERYRPTLLDDYNAFLKAFKEHFEDSDHYATALTKLRKLKQGSGSASSYALRFRKHAWELKLTDQTAIQMFYDGLKDSIKDAITIANAVGGPP
ncbi:hypothetical protein D9613_009316 [Agrocybe pediades]|uniref:Retrotransposon gag domain-containing protein n=1 Tax=Agrocybe pediades TaxID=84607 RepID=A0A8H4VTS7_9AGAR|nr:hypothetical protein D9613_009316 [Agrocybe pediades]